MQSPIPVKKKGEEVLPFSALPCLPLPSSPFLLPLPVPFPLPVSFSFSPKISYKESSASTLARMTAMGDSLSESSFQKSFTPAQIGFTSCFLVTGSGNPRNVYKTFKLEADLHACGRRGKGEDTVPLGQHFRILGSC